eukprot:1319324-Amorphochlora_amoeboformis.AAC.1
MPMEPPRFAETVNVSDIVRREPEEREFGERRAVSPVGEGVREEVQEVGDGNKEVQLQENDLGCIFVSTYKYICY